MKRINKLVPKEVLTLVKTLDLNFEAGIIPHPSGSYHWQRVGDELVITVIPNEIINTLWNSNFSMQLAKEIGLIRIRRYGSDET